MLTPRVIPVLLLGETGVVKSVRFRSRRYVGCPVNAARVFAAAGADELVVLDILAGPERRAPRRALVADIAEECLMPLTAGGGVRTLGDFESLLSAGADKVAINTAALEDPGFVGRAAARFGSQCVVVSVDARAKDGGWEVVADGGRRPTGLSPAAFCRRMQEEGAGEILLTSIDRDGTREGYDLELVREVAGVLSIPLVACGGAGRAADLSSAVAPGLADAAAAGTLFLYYGPRDAVLVSYVR